MKFISHIRKYQLGILTPVKELTNMGEREIVPMYNAVFSTADLTAEELEFAERQFGRDANGRTFETDQVTPTPLIGRLSTYDTEDEKNLRDYEIIDRKLMGQQHPDLPRGEVWREGSMKEMVEAKLMAREPRSDSFKRFSEPPVQPPWPTYDEFPGTTEDLLEVLLHQGHHLPQVLAYERQNAKRGDVIEALEAEIALNPLVPAELVS